jgi:hypothetical protein
MAKGSGGFGALWIAVPDSFSYPGPIWLVLSGGTLYIFVVIEGARATEGAF